MPTLRKRAVTGLKGQYVAEDQKNGWDSKIRENHRLFLRHRAMSNEEGIFTQQTRTAKDINNFLAEPDRPYGMAKYSLKAKMKKRNK